MKFLHPAEYEDEGAGGAVGKMTRLPAPGGVVVAKDATGNGTYVMVNAETRYADLVAASMIETLRLQNIPLTGAVFARVRREALEHEEAYYEDIRARGICGPLRQLMKAKRKAEAIRVIKGMIIGEQDLADLLENCAMLRLSHHAKHLHYVPPNRELSDRDRDALAYPKDAHDGGVAARAAARRVEQIFEEREHRSVHLLSGPDGEWHVFYVTFRDVAGDPSTGQNHWKHGSHVHYVSHLLEPRQTKDAVWKALDEHTYKIAACQHIRLRAQLGDGSRKRTYISSRGALSIESPVQIVKDQRAR